MKVRLAAVQPRSGGGADEARNAREALDWLDRAAAAGADLVMFPEGYPGPVNPVNTFDAFGPLAERAARHKLHVLASRVATVAGGYAVELHLIDDTGKTAGIYRRTTPVGPYVYRDVPAWDFNYVASATPPQVVETRLGRIGMLVCSELYTPELSRLLAIQGADIILYPAGGAINEFLPGWRTLVWARAVENLVFTAASQNLFGDDEEGVGTIAAPEGVLAASTGEGLLIADLDMDRLAFLRGQDEKITFPKPYKSIPGLLRWRRPALYGALAVPTEPAKGDVD